MRLPSHYQCKHSVITSIWGVTNLFYRITTALLTPFMTFLRFAVTMMMGVRIMCRSKRSRKRYHKGMVFIFFKEIHQDRWCNHITFIMLMFIPSRLETIFIIIEMHQMTPTTKTKTNFFYR